MSKIAIYAHGGTERNIKDQIDFCRNRIHLDYDKDTAEKALIFKDISSPSFKSKKELNLLLNEVKSKNITKIYVDDINIFARDMNTIAEVCNELINNNCEVIFGYSKEPLTKEYVNLKLSFTNHIQNSLLKSIRHGKYVKKMINNTTSIVSSSVKDGRRFKKKVGSIKEILNIEVNDYGNSDFEHDNVFWYGGEAASIKTSSGEYKIVARGQVRCNLIAKEDYIDKDGNKVKKGDIIATVIDKNQDGLFKNVMIPFIKNDYELNSILEYEHEKYELNIENNNWFELEFYNKEGELEYDDNILDSSTLTDAIEETKELIWDQNKDLKKYAIYCRLSGFKDNPELYFKNNEDYCLKALNSKVSRDSELIKIYIDHSPSKISSNAALGVLLDDVKNKKIKDIFTLSLTRITRDMDVLLDMMQTLKANNSDIYLIDENKYLVKDLSHELLILKGLQDVLPHEELEEEIDEIEYE